MDLFALMGQAFLSVLAPENLLYLVGGVIIGLIMGAIPGLTATMAIALIIPFTYYLTPTQSLIMLLAAYNAGTFGGSMSAILIGTPAGKAIKTALFSSAFGCLFSSIVLMFVAQPIAKYALNFGPAEYTILMLFALTIIASAAGKSMIKGLLGGCLGLLFGCIGLDQGFTTPRLTFGILKLTSGVDLVVMMIGILAMSQILHSVESTGLGNARPNLPPPACKDDDRMTLKEAKSFLPHWLRSSALGCGIGALPGLGPALACYIGYDVGKKFSKHPEKFGKGSTEGVACSESANNAVCGANMIPLLALGVPGDTGAAILMGAFMVQGLTPGPLVFMESPDTVYNVYAGLILCNIALVVVALLTWRGFKAICSVSTSIIFPCVCLFCVVGVYALSSSLVDVWVMLFFSVVGYILTKFKFPLPTVIIGFILSPLFEKNFRRALVLGHGDPAMFFSSPLCIAFWAVTIVAVVLILRGKRKDKNLQDGL